VAFISHDLPPEDEVSTQAQPFLIVGLGNPGRIYRNNRHNVGFMLLDRVAERLQTNFSRLQLKALVTDTRHRGKRIFLAKPQTFMNESGQATGSLVRFYKIPLDHLLVVHDDLDIPLGTLRMRPFGGAGGQKGMRSIINHLGEETFPRLRLGVGRPPGHMDPADYLLQNFASGDTELLDLTLDRAVEAVIAFIIDGIQNAMTVYNRIEE
jgi:PTH1 family peptidyl-tRNA hydrolase